MPTCALDETVAQVRGRLGRWELCLVLAGTQRAVLGLVRAEALGMKDDRRIAEVMQEGPSTYRPHVTAEEMSKHLNDKPAAWVVVTTLSGRLDGRGPPRTDPCCSQRRRWLTPTGPLLQVG